MAETMARLDVVHTGRTGGGERAGGGRAVGTARLAARAGRALHCEPSRSPDISSCEAQAFYSVLFRAPPSYVLTFDSVHFHARQCAHIELLSDEVL